MNSILLDSSGVRPDEPARPAALSELEPSTLQAQRSTERDEVSLISLVNLLLRHLGILIAVPVLAVLGTVAVLAWTEPRYTAHSTFVPQSAESSTSRLSGLAQQFGMGVGNLGEGEPIQLYPVLLQSRGLLRSAALSEYRLPASERRGVFKGSLVEYYHDPEVAADDQVERVVGLLRDRVRPTADLAAGVITVRTEAESIELAEQLNQRLLELLDEFNLERRQTEAAAERRFVESRMRSAEEELLDAETRLEQFLTRNRMYQQSPELAFEAARLEQRVALRQQLYTSLAQAYEQARIEEVRNTAVITVIDHPEGSGQRAGMGFFIPLALALFLGTVVAVGIILMVEYMKRLRQEHPDEQMEFVALRRRILPAGIRRLLHLRS